jgi:GTP cyclohydrolase I
VQGVAVFADAEHLCMRMRGVRNHAKMTSTAYRGTFANREEKASILAIMRHRSPDQD